MVAARASGVLGGGLASEFASPDDEGVFKETALLEVLDEAGDGLVGVAGMVGVVLDEVAVGVPVCVVVVTPGVHLYEAYAAFHEAAGEEAFAAEVLRTGTVYAVEFLDVLGLGVEICVGGLTSPIGLAMIALFGLLVATGAAGDSPDRFVAQAPSASAGRYYERYDTPALELDGAVVPDEGSFFGYNAMR